LECEPTLQLEHTVKHKINTEKRFC